MASTAHFSEEEMAELREAFSKVGEYERKGVRSCSWLFAPTLTIHGENRVYTSTDLLCHRNHSKSCLPLQTSQPKPQQHAAEQY